MKRMICYFLLCTLVLACIAGCISAPPVSTPADGTTKPSGSVSLENSSNSQGTQQTEPGFTVPEYELEPLPTIDREKTGPLVEYDPDRELYILTGQNDIIYTNRWSNNYYTFRIYSKKPLAVNSISVKLPISYYYNVTVRQRELGGVQEGVGLKMDEQSYREESFSYPLYLAYRGKDFRKLAELYDKFKQLQVPTYGYIQMFNDKQITHEQLELLMASYDAAREEYYAYLDAEWEDYLALTKQELPQFYAYTVLIDFTDINNLGAKWEQEESFTQIEVTIGNEIYVQDIGKITLIEDWELPAQLDWEAGFVGIAGTLGSVHGPRPYNEGIHCIQTYFRYTTDRYELLEELVMLNPTQKLERG